MKMIVMITTVIFSSKKQTQLMRTDYEGDNKDGKNRCNDTVMQGCASIIGFTPKYPVRSKHLLSTK